MMSYKHTGQLPAPVTRRWLMGIKRLHHCVAIAAENDYYVIYKVHTTNDIPNFAGWFFAQFSVAATSATYISVQHGCRT